ncbi:MAG: DUF1178 family protein [Pseudomonadota bacterium]
MIKYTLTCADEHTFEAWFRSSADYDTQRDKGILECPVCGSTKIEKSLMAPNLGAKSNQRDVTASSPSREFATPETSESAPLTQPDSGAASNLPTEVHERVVELAREIRDHVRKTADNVGTNFAEEARKIHYEEAEPRGIYGNATPKEAHDLKEEGIDVHPLPVLPEDRN